MAKSRMYVLIGICAVSALLGIGLGYFVFGPIGFSAREADLENNADYEIFQKYAPNEPDFLLAYSDITPEHNPGPDDSPAEAPSPEPLHRFVVTTLDGYIVVYHAALDGRGEIMEITSTPVNALPLVEQSRLAQGIRIYTEEALIRILEDYGS
ncbi:MAG: hypothetical protein FWB91_03755 [Defluviitaleaceae bacterium]|nr:hypothetical protein [Defluviitaleaceae bacterium]